MNKIIVNNIFINSDKNKIEKIINKSVSIKGNVNK